MKIRVYFLIGIFAAQQSYCMETKQSPRNMAPSNLIMPEITMALLQTKFDTIQFKKKPHFERVKQVHNKHTEISLANTLDLINVMKETGSLKTVTLKQPIVDNE